jgi:hypothetical protein
MLGHFRLVAMSIRGLLGAVLLVACGGPPAPTQPAPPADAVTASSTSSAQAEPPEGRCLATTTRHRPDAGWTEVGKLVVALADGQPTSFEAQDASGTVLESKPAPKNGKAARELIENLTCRLGGLIALLDGPEPSKEGAATASMIVLRPIAPDERADISVLCAAPSGMPAGAGESQKLRIALALFDERLTSLRWRAWLRDLAVASADTEGAARIATRTSKADELRAAADRTRVNGACWLETLLRRRE